MPPTRDFFHSDAPEPHRARTKEILRQHPEIRSLIGRNPWSLAIIALIVGIQISIAILLRDQAWWLALAIAWLFGAFMNHTLYVLIHECSHNGLFKNRAGNLLAGILADLPNVVPGSVSFRSYHLKHHSFQGHYDLDADLPYHWEARLIGSTFIGKALWLLFFPVFQALRPMRMKEIAFMNAWTMVNWIAVFSFDAAIIILFGPVSFLYLAASLFFSIGLHPVGARWIQEHFIVRFPQETYSYYGPINVLALNVGYHNEHHDFPSVPWNRLRAVKRTAPEWYDPLYAHSSWTKLLFRFLFDRNLTLFSRVVRSDRDGVAIAAD